MDRFIYNTSMFNNMVHGANATYFNGLLSTCLQYGCRIVLNRTGDVSGRAGFGIRLVQYGSTEAAGKVIHSRKELAQLR